MENPQKLQDAFEDAYFAILMDAFSEYEGERLLAENKRLAVNPIDLPEGMDARIFREIDHAFSKLRWRRITRVGRRIVSRAAIVILVAAVLFSTLCVASSAFRERVLNVVVKWHAQYTSFSFEEQTKSAEESVPHEPYWLPEGYSMVSEKEEDGNIHYSYEDKSGNRLAIYIKNGSFIATIDTENAENVENITVIDYQGLITIKNNTIKLTWGDVQKNIIVSIICDGMERECVLSVAESMYN